MHQDRGPQPRRRHHHHDRHHCCHRHRCCHCDQSCRLRGEHLFNQGQQQTHSQAASHSHNKDSQSFRALPNAKSGRDDQKALRKSRLRNSKLRRKKNVGLARHIESLVGQQSLKLAIQPIPGDTRNMDKLIRVDHRHSMLLLLPQADHPTGFPELLQTVPQVVLADMLMVETWQSSLRDSISWKTEISEDRFMMQRHYFLSSWMIMIHRAQKDM